MNYSQGKGRLYPAYSLSGSEGEDNSVGTRGGRVGYSQNNHQTSQSQQHNHYNTSQHKQRTGSFQQQPQQQHPLYHVANSGAGLSDTPTSGNASDETLTDCELTHLAREWNVVRIKLNDGMRSYNYENSFRQGNSFTGVYEASKERDRKFQDRNEATIEIS
ncbi:uncharacterized protein LOC135170485 [Diachasmimorpha longicaudata]|uniref:uncharacterized protein LOC135170485 n=1 Tax=Diachasmimorpha longicaudata TaxID=58733 RepID=UPI0030B8BBE6